MTLTRGKKMALAVVTIGNGLIGTVALLAYFEVRWIVTLFARVLEAAPWTIFVFLAAALLSNLVHYALLLIYVLIASKIEMGGRTRVFWIVLMLLIGVFGQIPFLFAKVWQLPERPEPPDSSPLLPALLPDAVGPQV